MNVAVSVLVREGPLVAPSPGVQVASSITKVLANVRAAVRARKVSFRDRVSHILCIPLSILQTVYVLVLFYGTASLNNE